MYTDAADGEDHRMHMFTVQHIHMFFLSQECVERKIDWSCKFGSLNQPSKFGSVRTWARTMLEPVWMNWIHHYQPYTNQLDTIILFRPYTNHIPTIYHMDPYGQRCQTMNVASATPRMFGCLNPHEITMFVGSWLENLKFSTGQAVFYRMIGKVNHVNPQISSILVVLFPSYLC